MNERIEYLSDKPYPDLKVGDLVDAEFEGLGVITVAPWRSADCDLEEVDEYFLTEVRFSHGRFAVDTDDLTVVNKC